MIGAAHLEYFTGEIIPWSCKRYSSASTFPFKAYGKDLALQNFGGTEGSMWMPTFSPCKVPSSPLNTSLKECSNYESLSSTLRIA